MQERLRWGDWGEEAFALARAQGRPLLLALTARWCLACRRMDEETWSHPGVAAAVERATVPLKVDADARPDLYDRYHLGGLPTTALLTPAGDFIRGGTFLSPPRLFALLEAGLADFAAGRRPGPRRPRPRAGPPRLVDEVVARLRRRADPEHGGFGVAPKQPEVEALTLLLRLWRAGGDASLAALARASLDAIMRHLQDADGGFFRYAAGADWSGPHTEKLALDQARLARLCLEAGVALEAPAYLHAAGAALGHARRRLADDRGRVFSSIPARAGPASDDRAAEGDAAGDDDAPPADRRRFAGAGAAMVSAGRLALAVTGEDAGFAPEYRLLAPSGAVPHRLDEPGGLSGLLRDQALALGAALDEYRLGGDPGLLEWSRRLADWSLEHLWDEGASAFRAVPDGLVEPAALPPLFPLVANGEMALGLADLAAHAGREDYRGHAARIVASLGAAAARSPAGAAVALAAQRLEAGPAEADLRGERGDPRALDLARAALAALGPMAVLRWKAGGPPALTLCAGDLCLPPLDEPMDLLRTLADLGMAPQGILGLWSPSSGQNGN